MVIDVVSTGGIAGVKSAEATYPDTTWITPVRQRIRNSGSPDGGRHSPVEARPSFR